MSRIIKDTTDILLIGFIIMLIITCSTMCFKSCNEQYSKTTSPVEECRIDSAKEANTVLIVEVEKLDSIKHVKSVEVTTINNDSTLKLFYELIGK